MNSAFFQKFFVFFFAFSFFAFPLIIHAVSTEKECLETEGETRCDLDCGTTSGSGYPIGLCTDRGSNYLCCKQERVNNQSSCNTAGGTCSDTNQCSGGQTKIGLCDEINPKACCKDMSSILSPGTQPVDPVNASFNYTPLEPIPGIDREDSDTFPEFIESIYVFALWSVGIASLFMLTIGGFWYMTSAGNTSRVGEAKNIIASALVGLLIALITWLILYVLNPDLVRINIDLDNFFVAGTTRNLYPSTGPGAGPGNGQCEPVPSGPCSVSNLQQTCLGSNAEVFSNICNVESAGKADSASESDICKDGNPFSFGLFQINLTVHTVNGLNCPKAFSGKNYSCTVINESLYKQCIQAATNPTININKSCEISKNGQNVGPWKNSAKKCGYL